MSTTAKERISGGAEQPERVSAATGRSMSVFESPSGRNSSVGGSKGTNRISLGRVIDDEMDLHPPLKLINIIFLPFHDIFRKIILFVVLVKCIMGPLQSVYPIQYCKHLENLHWTLHYSTYVYTAVDPIYAIDFFLHVVHRQVTDEAMKREHLPKSAICLILDLFSLLPLYRLLAVDECPQIQLWPNILSFNEFLIAYRVIEYFSLKTTHSMSKLIVGYLILCFLLFNCLTCFILLVTLNGLCDQCTGTVYYDWRSFEQFRFPDLHENFNMYILAAVLSVCYITNNLNDEVKPNAYSEFVIATILMTLIYALVMFILMPKLFGEYMLRMRRVAHFHPRVTRIIMETQRRNPSRVAHLIVENFYALSWKKSRGLTAIPEVINELPRYLRLDIIQDLSWPVFYHSPTFRNTSASYKRWLSEHIRLEYKFPGERFFSGKHCYTNLYYIKSGIVQLISADDSTSPLLSVSGGTVFGDISFYTPPLHRKVMVRCFTFCEILVIFRFDILSSLHKFREDRHEIIKLTQGRITHARTLYACKDSVRGQDRSKDEGIAWIKARWWQISTILAKWKHAKREATKCELPAEETLYHCAKYIGQLVLCANNQLAMNTMFSKVTFPWILVPNSTFGVIWNRIVIYTLYLVILLYPPNLTRNRIPIWFKLFQFAVDVIYVVDIFVSLMTATEKRENDTFVTVLLARVKTLHFIVDLLSTAWIENVVFISGSPQVRQHCQYNRLLKTYMLFLPGGFRTDWNRYKNPLHNVLLMIVFTQFCTVYVSCFFFYIIHKYVDSLTTKFLFSGQGNCQKNEKNCDQDSKGFLALLFGWIIQIQLTLTTPKSYSDVFLGNFLKLFAFIFMAWMETKFIAALYLKYKHKISYNMFVANLKAHYMHYKIHPDLLKRLDRYLTCQWKYFNGMDVLQPNLLKDEPYDIYWRFHGAVAEQIIGSSDLFKGADTALIKELASKARFTIIPKGSTLSVFGVECRNVTWVVNGIVRVEYHDEEGELVTQNISFRRMISLSAVFFDMAGIKNYIAASDCEILFITKKEFVSTIKRYPLEWSYIDICIQEFQPKFEDAFLFNVKKHIAYQRKLRDQIFHARQSVAVVKLNVDEPSLGTAGDTMFFLDAPETSFIIYWSAFRAFIVIINIWNMSIQVGSGALFLKYLGVLDAFCDGVGLIDIVFKMIMPYYDDRGLIINEWRKCMWRYISHSFIIDLCGTLPVLPLARDVLQIQMSPSVYATASAVIKCLLLYNFIGFFNYFTDHPTGRIVYLLLLKWQIILITVLLAVGSTFIPRCIAFTYDNDNNLIEMRRMFKCWDPGYNILLEHNITAYNLHLIFAQSLDFVQCGLLKSNTGGFMIRKYTVATFILLGTFFWCLLCYAKTLLILNQRGSSLFHYGVDKLLMFLKEERVPQAVIERVMNHYDYWWLRTNGMTTANLMTERMGNVFKQDLYFYFFKKTLGALDELLAGGDTFQRQLANIVETSYFLPNEYITREMDLMPHLYVVHRGSVVIYKNGKKLATITKGSIFGQLDGVKIRPIRITALAHEHADVLEIKIKNFQEIITNEIRENIANNPDSANDFMSLRKTVHENPFNTIQYILRGRKTVKLPWMRDPRDIQSCVWYGRWLYCVWLFVTTAIIMLSLVMPTLPNDIYKKALWILFLLDVIYFVQFVSELFTMELVVDGNKCVYEYIRLKRLLKVGLYLDLIAFIAPIVAVVKDMRGLHMARLLRIHVFFDFYRYFCMDLQTKATPILMKFIIMILLIHSMTCGWIYFACRGLSENVLYTATEIPEWIKRTINFNQWSLPQEREEGCMRTTISYRTGKKSIRVIRHFVVGKHWNIDYLVAFSYIIVLITNTDMLLTVPLSISQTYYKIFITMISSMIEIWISSVTISTIYIKFRELYQYDYNIRNLIKYLRCNGISKALVKSLVEYTKMLWRRQKGNWLPELAREAPLCLREDIFTSLYIHHLEGLNIFNQLPEYFLRQLACRFRRMVIFPGKHIVESGDIYSTMFFIHEGEVERWYTDSNGDSRIVSVLTQNQTFGNIPGLYSNEPFAFTYFSRTVVDLVYLVYDDWKDLMEGYPDLKKEIYIAARALKKQISMGKALR